MTRSRDEGPENASCGGIGPDTIPVNEPRRFVLRVRRVTLPGGHPACAGDGLVAIDKAQNVGLPTAKRGSMDGGGADRGGLSAVFVAH